METENIVVDADLIYLEEIFNWFEHIKHFHSFYERLMDVFCLLYGV